MSHDLFGDPIPVLSKGTTGYLVQLADLTIGDGWQFWALAEPIPKAPRPTPVGEYECVWLARDGQYRHAWISLTTGEEVGQ